MPAPSIQPLNEFVVAVYHASVGAAGVVIGNVPKRGRLKRILTAFNTTHATATSTVTIEKNGVSIAETLVFLNPVTAPAVQADEITPFAGANGVIQEFAKGDSINLNSDGLGSAGEATYYCVFEELAENRP